VLRGSTRRTFALPPKAPWSALVGSWNNAAGSDTGVPLSRNSTGTDPSAPLENTFGLSVQLPLTSHTP